MKPEPDVSGNACPRIPDATDYVLGEMNAGERKDFEAHMVACRICAGHVREARLTVARMLAAPEPARLKRDLAPDVLRRIGETPHPASHILRFRPALAAAAILLALLGGLAGPRLWRSHGAPEIASTGSGAQHSIQAAREKAIAWLCEKQCPDGSWVSGESGDGNRMTVALTSLSLLALIGSEVECGDHCRQIGKAVDYLCAQQNADGDIGPAIGNAPFNHSLATLALLLAYDRLHDDRLKPVLDRAVTIICWQQAPSGGWRNWAAHARTPNMAVAIWQVEALKLAGRMGWNDAGELAQQAAQALADLPGCVETPSGLAAGEDRQEAMIAVAAANILDAGAGVQASDRQASIRSRIRTAFAKSPDTTDYFWTYFLASAMKGLNDIESTTQLAAIRGSIVSHQVMMGMEKGSWPTDERGRNIGGNVYSTAMALLALE